MTEQTILPMRDYGDFDPLRETLNYINSCSCGHAVCGNDIVHDTPFPEQMGFPKTAEVTVKRAFIICPNCCARGPAAKQVIYAVLQWNLSSVCSKPSYKSLPLFGVSGLPNAEAVLKLQCIKNDLHERVEDCEKCLKLPDVSKHPGPRYHAKLLAYRAWNYYALYLASDDPFFKSNPNGVLGTSNGKQS